MNGVLQELVFDELKQHCNSRGFGGFLPAVKQIANVAALPGIVKASIGLYKNYNVLLCIDILCSIARLSLWLRICYW